MKILLKKVYIGTSREFKNKDELIEFTKKYIEKKGIIDNSFEHRVLFNKNVTIYDCLEVLKGDYIRVYNKI